MNDDDVILIKTHTLNGYVAIAKSGDSFKVIRNDLTFVQFYFHASNLGDGILDALGHAVDQAKKWVDRERQS